MGAASYFSSSLTPGDPWKYGVLSIASNTFSREKNVFLSIPVFCSLSLWISLFSGACTVVMQGRAQTSGWIMRSHITLVSMEIEALLCCVLPSATAGLLHHPGQAQLSACMKWCRQQHVSISQGCTGWLINEHLESILGSSDAACSLKKIN